MAHKESLTHLDLGCIVLLLFLMVTRSFGVGREPWHLFIYGHVFFGRWRARGQSLAADEYAVSVCMDL